MMHWRTVDVRIKRMLLALIGGTLTGPVLVVFDCPVALLGFFVPYVVISVAAVRIKWWHIGMGLLYSVGASWPLLLLSAQDKDPTGPGPVGGPVVFADYVGSLMLWWLVPRALKFLWNIGQVPG